MPVRSLQIFSLALTISTGALCAQTPQATPPPGPTTDTSVIDAQGAAHITRVVPVPDTLSPEARAWLSKPASDAAHPTTLAERRAGTTAWQTRAGKESLAVYPVKITEDQKIAGIPVRIIDPLPEAKIGPISGPGATADPLHYAYVPAPPTSQATGAQPSSPVHTDQVLLCLHGGGFTVDSGSYTESIPLANLTRTRVVSVLYRLAPENPYPAQVDDAVAVYRELLKTHKPQKIVIYGTSAGAILTAEVAARLKTLGLPQPAALGVFSGFGDYSTLGDTSGYFALNGLSGHLDAPAPNPDHHSSDPDYTTSHSPRDPVISPIYGDLHGLPPTLFITGTRDVLLSGTSTMERAWRRDSVPTQLVVFDALPHAFWNDVSLPESREAYAIMANFFLEKLKP